MEEPLQSEARTAAAFGESEDALRLQRRRVGLALGSLLMPAGLLLDFSQYPQQFGLLLTIRLLTTVILAGGLVCTYFVQFGKRFSVYSLALVTLPSVAIAMMVFVTDGSRSTYYVGLILVMLVVQLIGFAGIESAIYCGITSVAYILAMVCHRDFVPDDLPRVAQIAFFLFATSAVCVTLCHLNYRNRRSEFFLRLSLDEKNRQLEHLDQLRTDFLANVSHELRTPLTLIVAPLQELLSATQPLPQEVGESLGLINRNVDRLYSLVNDLLDIVRIDNAVLRLDRQLIDAREFLQGITRSVKPFAETKNIRLETELSTQELNLFLDVMRAERVLLNLLQNALKFTPAGGRVIVSLRRAGVQAVIAVEDDGPGILASERQKVFDRFYQSANGKAPAQGLGLGLGLAIAREIVRQHGGELALEDGRLRGCCFVVRIPLANEHDIQTETSSPLQSANPNLPLEHSQAIPAASSASELDGQAPDLKNLVLVIDDEEDLRRYLMKSLIVEYAVIGCPNGSSGIKAATANPPCCILLDLMLPDMSGLDVLSKLRQISDLNDTKIIVLTANTDERPKIAALRSGADDFLSKPFSITEVRARVAGMVRSSLAQAELRREREELERSMRELKQTQGQLIQSEKMRALGSLAAGLLHEINNPVNYTLMAVRILEKDLPAAPQMTETVADIRQGIQRISEIITDLRGFAYAESETAPTPFSLLEVVEGVRRFAAHELDDINFQVADSVKPVSGLRVVGLRSQVMQVLLNLVLNAATAIRKCAAVDSPTITLSARREQQRAFITVQDNGCGIPADRLPRVCDPFYTSAEPGKGLGLGLSICDTIVRRHGGRLRITSEEGHGTAVEFDLPLELSSGISV